MWEKYIENLRKDGQITLKIKALPGRGKSGIVGFLEDGTIKVGVLAQPEKGQANSELFKYLAKELGVLPSNLKIISGATRSLKLIKVKL